VAKWGMQPVSLPSGSDALNHLRQGEAFDFAILDMHMPEMDGLSLAETIHARHNTETLPIIIWTSVAMRRETAEQNQTTIAAFLIKPVRPSMLYNTLLNIARGETAATRQMGTHSPAEQTVQRHPLRILVAEDNIINQQVALRLLERIGYRANMAANGFEVLEMLRRQPYDIILMDVQMPEMDGIETTQRIRNHLPPSQQPRIIAMTAYAMEGDREWCLQAGMDDYIGKPVRAEELSQKLLSIQSECPVPPPDPPAAPPPSASIDEKVYQQFVAMVGPTVLELLDIFLANTPSDFAAMRQAIAANDACTLTRLAHTLKSSSAQLGATTLSALCRKLEKTARAGTLEGTADLLAQLEAEYELVKELFEEKKSEHVALLQ